MLCIPSPLPITPQCDIYPFGPNRIEPTVFGCYVNGVMVMTQYGIVFAQYVHYRSITQYTNEDIFLRN